MAKLEAKLGMIVDKVNQFFSGNDLLPSCDPDIIAKHRRITVILTYHHDTKHRLKGCEREVAEAEKLPSSDEVMQESLLRLSWALVHSKRPEDVQRGIAMLQTTITNAAEPLRQREKLYLLAVGYYRSGDYSRSRDLVETCLEIAPDWRQALTLKEATEERIKKDGLIGIGIAATAAAATVGLIAGGIAAAVSRKR